MSEPPYGREVEFSCGKQRGRGTGEEEERKRLFSRRGHREKDFFFRPLLGGVHRTNQKNSCPSLYIYMSEVFGHKRVLLIISAVASMKVVW